MSKKVFLSVLLSSCIMLQGATLWAWDDAIMDVDDNAASFTGTWPSSTYRILYYGDDYQYASGSGTSANTAEVTFVTATYARVTGNFVVYVRWTAGNMRATNAVYRIYDANTYVGGCTKDQRFNGGAWQYCDTVKLTYNHKAQVKLGNANVPTNRYVCADAVRFVRQNWDRDDIVDVPGSEIGSEGSLNYSGLGPCSIGSASWKKLRTITLSNTPSHGRILVRANGIATHTLANQYIRVCLGDSGGCDSLAPYIQQSSTEISQSWARETRWAVNETYSAGGTKTFYLYACKSEFAGGTIMWDDVTAIYLPKNY